MNTPIIHAETDFGTLLYIVIVFFWAIANMVSKARKKKNRRAAPLPRAGESTAEKELREFLETIAGEPVEAESVPEPAPPPPPPPRRVRVREKPHTAGPAILPPKRWSPPAQIQAEDINLEEIAEELRDGATSMAGSFATTLSSGGSLFKTTGLTMPSVRYALSSSRPRPKNPVLTREALNTKQDLRRLVVGQIILGAPRAFEPYGSTQEGRR
jgi:hypothetical protein